ncbi:MAG: hypothetical protein UR26_C0006G0055 [candidate division TM6 bacterium GW2011_GWF2_32_72]|nr:MAG: hypothetical protein UR26_C0006G0055 [candidate division TM6 bacterium GW2011_GWF2_32_72]
MTAFEHQIVGLIVFFLIWMLFLKRYFYTKKNMQDIQKVINEFFYNRSR